MFKLSQNRRVTWPVTVSSPQDGGKVTKEKFEVVFEVLTKTEQDQATAEGKDLLQLQVVGWPEGPLAKDGTTRVTFTEEAKAELLGVLHARMALFEAIGEINTGRAAARKN